MISFVTHLCHRIYTMSTLLCWLLFLSMTTSATADTAEAYLGCFQDDCTSCDPNKPSGTLLSYTMLRLDNEMTIDRCFEHCLGWNRPGLFIRYAGVEAGTDCYCDLDGTDYDRFGNRTDCNTPCAGDITQTCGGNQAIAVYDLYRKYCRVSTFKNGDVTNTDDASWTASVVSVGMSVTFTCDTGYYLDGASSLQCVDPNYPNPEWDSALPVCRQLGACSPSCYNGGTCTELNTCRCRNGYMGSRCKTPVCSLFCSNGGICTAPNTCSCQTGYTGQGCETPVCSPSCSNGGTCTAPDACSCQTGYTGQRCETPVCSPSCSNGGTCTAPDTCSCQTGYTGQGCETPVCSTSCSNGRTCTAPNTCSCQTGYTGQGCETPVCSLPCLNNGNCTSPDVCGCPSGYTGSRCQLESSDATMGTITTDTRPTVSPVSKPTDNTDTSSSQIGIIAGLSAGMIIFIILFVIFLSFYIHNRRKSSTTTTKNGTSGPETRNTTQLSHKIQDYQNVTNPAEPKDTETYIGLDQTSQHPESVYQGIKNPEKPQSIDEYQSLDANTITTKDAEYESLNKNGQQGDGKRGYDLIYHEISENKAGQAKTVYENTSFTKTDETNGYSNIRQT